METTRRGFFGALLGGIATMVMARRVGRIGPAPGWVEEVEERLVVVGTDPRGVGDLEREKIRAYLEQRWGVKVQAR